MRCETHANGKCRMRNNFRRRFDEEASANEFAVAVRPDEENVAITENVAFGDDSFRVYLFKFVILRLSVIL